MPPLRRILCLLLFCIGFSGFYIPLAQAEEPEQASLTLTPSICITSDAEKACKIDIELQWKLVNKELICILSDNSAYPKWCSESIGEQHLKLSISTQSDIQFVMVSKATNQTLAGAKLKVAATAQSQVRRRYRNPWSLF
ncbi:DUF3019 domain-containing protein [Shewanella sp. A25]|nr:DUF3019 domain-containing protein [Shewanella shenzhenensis]